ncbi:MAG: ABC transporter ATP-binding protein [Chloroflexi bacterium]|nr:ABC transporter ATP-binding protein [Chloroflexota bacterium]MYC48332.1 ABC transporter ATP-binding protein [Chloroflexota bacterium]
MPGNDLTIQARGLHKRYGKVHALAGMDLDVPTGSVYGLLGPNGAGKTTFLGILLGLIKPNSGSLELFGQPASRDRPQALRRVGAVIETPLFYPYLSGRRNLEVMGRYWGSIEPARIDEVLETVGLTDRADSKFKTYSSGMRQRLGLANALLVDPDLLVLDEPTAGLDPAGAYEFRNLIRSVAQRADATVVLSSHLLAEVEQVCDRVGILVAGNTVVQGDVATLLAGGRGVRYRVGDSGRALDLLSGSDYAATATGDGELVVQIEPEDAGKVNQLLVQDGIEVTAIATVSIDLETFFLDKVRAGEAS